MNLILVGFMGSGKTTVSTLLGEALQQPVYDLDDEVEKAACKPIPQIFADDGGGRVDYLLFTDPPRPKCLRALF